MTKTLLYLFGEPGTGKITVARILQQRLGWKLFWLHDLDSVCQIVGRYPLPRLMDEISLAVLEALMEGGEDVIYVRPSRDRETVEEVLCLAARYPHRAVPVRLTASKETMRQRVSSRPLSQFRASSEADLDRYLSGRPATSVEVEAYTVSTDGIPPEWIAAKIQKYLECEEKVRGNRNVSAAC